MAMRNGNLDDAMHRADFAAIGESGGCRTQVLKVYLQRAVASGVPKIDASCRIQKSIVSRKWLSTRTALMSSLRDDSLGCISMAFIDICRDIHPDAHGEEQQLQREQK
jgi:hypothetical protein